MPSTWTQLYLHIVFSTKDREPWINEALQQRLHPFLGGIVRDEGGVALAIGGMPDHVHLLVRWRTDDSIANLMRNVKARSSGWVHQEFPELRRFAWQEGYGVFSVSASLRETVTKYIEQQAQHHASRTFKEELVELLDRHGVEYDPRYLF